MVFLNHVGLVCALGDNAEDICERLYSGSTPINQHHDYDSLGEWYLGDVKAALPSVPEPRDTFDTRCNRLLLAAMAQLEPALSRAITAAMPERVGVVLGTSTSGIPEGEAAVREQVRSGEAPATYDYRQQMIGHCARYVAGYIGATGPALTVSTACSSSGNAIITAARLLATNTCDLVIAGGVDSLCKMTVRGFSSLEAVSRGIANPFGEGRDGINLGEGAALFMMSREPQGMTLMGYGASSDAHHISAPHPEGAGAKRAIREALAMAGIDAGQVDYVNLHGTGTVLNDLVEAHVINDIFGPDTPCSSTKAMTGHTLGAAAAVEAALCWMGMERHLGVIPHQWLGPYDPALPPINLASTGLASPNVCMSNSFAFGGSNVSLILGRPVA